MAYSTSNPPILISTGLAGTGQIWKYDSTDAAAVVDTDGYFSNGQLLGMKVGDLVIVRDTDASPSVTTLHTVASLSTSDNSVDLLDAGATVDTDTD